MMMINVEGGRTILDTRLSSSVGGWRLGRRLFINRYRSMEDGAGIHRLEDYATREEWIIILSSSSSSSSSLVCFYLCCYWNESAAGHGVIVRVCSIADGCSRRLVARGPPLVAYLSPPWFHFWIFVNVWWRFGRVNDPLTAGEVGAPLFTTATSLPRTKHAPAPQSSIESFSNKWPLLVSKNDHGLWSWRNLVISVHGGAPGHFLCYSTASIRTKATGWLPDFRGWILNTIQLGVK